MCTTSVPHPQARARTLRRQSTGDAATAAATQGLRHHAHITAREHCSYLRRRLSGRTAGAPCPSTWSCRTRLRRCRRCCSACAQSSSRPARCRPPTPSRPPAPSRRPRCWGHSCRWPPSPRESRLWGRLDALWQPMEMAAPQLAALGCSSGSPVRSAGNGRGDTSIKLWWDHHRAAVAQDPLPLQPRGMCDMWFNALESYWAERKDSTSTTHVTQYHMPLR